MARTFVADVEKQIQKKLSTLFRGGFKNPD